jgi:hypothetical protein
VTRKFFAGDGLQTARYGFDLRSLLIAQIASVKMADAFSVFCYEASQ